MSKEGMNMVNQIEQNLDKQSENWLLKHIYCEGLEPHNRSIEWIIETIDELGAVVDIGGENRDHRSAHYSQSACAEHRESCIVFLYTIGPALRNYSRSECRRWKYVMTVP